MTRNAILGFALIAFCVAGVAVGFARLAPGRSPGEFALAAVFAVLGAAAFVAILRVGRRGTPQWAKWLFVIALFAALYLDRLSEAWQLALLSLTAGYVAAFLATIALRVKRMSG
ncbi:MAG: hypothetical protein ACYDA3_02420 [Gaiellaceae bacterium]